jgi:hypothetical protein
VAPPRRCQRATYLGPVLAINVNDLSTRVPVPPGHNEITRLVRTVNSTLGRLEDARAQADRAYA